MGAGSQTWGKWAGVEWGLHIKGSSQNIMLYLYKFSLGGNMDPALGGKHTLVSPPQMKPCTVSTGIMLPSFIQRMKQWNVFP